MIVDAAASIKAKLLAGARASGEEFERTLVRYADERLLYRLGASDARNSCLVKGASLLTVWTSDPYRATRDVDLLAFGPGDEEAICALVTKICAVACPEDGLQFDLSGLDMTEIRPEEEYAGKRVRFLALLGSARIHVQMDFGFGDAVGVESEEIVYPTILEHLPAPRLRAYPREVSVAEKFEAMIKLDTRNSRMKDFHDLWALSGMFAFKGQSLREAVFRCFERRGTPWTIETPRPLTTAFYEITELADRWNFYRSAASILVPPPERFTVVGEQVISFLGPIRESIVSEEPLEQHWPAGGPWQLATYTALGADVDV